MAFFAGIIVILILIVGLSVAEKRQSKKNKENEIQDWKPSSAEKNDTETAESTEESVDK